MSKFLQLFETHKSKQFPLNIKIQQSNLSGKKDRTFSKSQISSPLSIEKKKFGYTDLRDTWAKQTGNFTEDTTLTTKRDLPSPFTTSNQEADMFATTGTEHKIRQTIKSLSKSKRNPMEIGLINDSLYDGLGYSTEMQKYRIRLLKQNLNRYCKMKDCGTVMEFDKVKSKVFPKKLSPPSYLVIDHQGQPVASSLRSPSPITSPLSESTPFVEPLPSSLVLTDGYLRLNNIISKHHQTTYVKEHHFVPTQVKRNPVVDLDSTSTEAHTMLFSRNIKANKQLKSNNFLSPKRLSNLIPNGVTRINTSTENTSRRHCSYKASQLSPSSVSKDLEPDFSQVASQVKSIYMSKFQQKGQISNQISHQPKKTNGGGMQNLNDLLSHEIDEDQDHLEGDFLIQIQDKAIRRKNLQKDKHKKEFGEPVFNTNKVTNRNQNTSQFRPEQMQNVAELKIEVRLKQLNDLSHSKDPKWKKQYSSQNSEYDFFQFLEKNVGKTPKAVNVEFDESPTGGIKKKMAVTSPVTEQSEKAKKIFNKRKTTNFPNLSPKEITEIEAKVRKNYVHQ